MKVNLRLANEGGDLLFEAPIVTYASDGDGDLRIRCMDGDGGPAVGSALYARGEWVGVRVVELPDRDVRAQAEKLQRKAEQGD